MKTAAIYRTKMHSRPAIPYPTAAERRQMLDKLVDTALVAATGIGSAAILLLMLVLA